MKILAVLIVMFSMCAQCRAYEDKRSLEDLLAIWFDKLSWSEKDGFGAMIVRENPPGHIYIEGQGYLNVPIENGWVCFEKGKPYFLTNGYGRSQRVRFVDHEAEVTNSVVYRVFGREESLLYFEHLEIYERYGEPIPRAFVISAKGEAYDVERREKKSFALPFAASVRASFLEKVRQDVCDSSCGNIAEVHRDRNQVLSWLSKNADKVSGLTNEIAEVCYFERPGNVADYRTVLRHQELEPEFREFLEGEIKEHDSLRRWALIRRFEDGFHIVGVSVGFRVGDLRMAWFGRNGIAEAILYYTKSNDQSMLYRYDEKGNMVVFLDYIKGRVNNFWVRENGELVVCKDEAKAKKLIDETLVRTRQFKRGAK